jgi:hypothetical protein
MQKIYYARCQEAEAHEALVARGQSANQTKRDFTKMQDNARRERKKASMAALEYKAAVDEYERTRSQYEDDMSSACYVRADVY